MAEALGLDTSIVVRLIVGEPRAAAARAQKRLELAFSRGDTVLVADLVVAEAYYALVYHYDVPKEEAEGMLEEMLLSGVVQLEPMSSHEAFGQTGVGFVDRLIHSRYAASGATTLTFDGKLARRPGVERP